MNRNAIILLNYNNAEETIKCIEMLTKIFDKSENNNNDIILVDNKSTDNSIKIIHGIQNKYVKEKIFSNENGGFAYGNNLGIKYALKENYEFITLLNNDLSIDNNIFDDMTNYLSKHQDVGIVGPKIITKYKVNVGNEIQFTNVTFDNALKSDEDNNPKNVGFLFGACLVSRADTIEKVGLIPECYFLNYEETEWCLNFHKHGYLVQCLPSYSVFHYGNGTISKYSGMQVYFLRRNIVMFEKRNASLIQKMIFYPKIFLIGTLQSIKHFNFLPLESYIDGLTGKNKYHKE